MGTTGIDWIECGTMRSIVLTTGNSCVSPEGELVGFSFGDIILGESEIKVAA
jgi:hypothetical protein